MASANEVRISVWLQQIRFVSGYGFSHTPPSRTEKGASAPATNPFSTENIRAPVTSDLSFHSHNFLIWKGKAWMFSRAILG